MAKSNAAKKVVEEVKEEVVVESGLENVKLELSEQDLSNLKTIAGVGDDGCYTPASVHTVLLEFGYVEINSGIVNEGGEVATRISKAGKKYLKDLAKAEKAAEPQIEITIEAGIEIPEVTGRGNSNRKSAYPLDKLLPGQSFFIPATEKRPEPSKSLSTAASLYRRKLREANGENGLPEFTVRIATHNGVDGARVWRTK